jgi:hypothetical protein
MNSLMLNRHSRRQRRLRAEAQGDIGDGAEAEMLAIASVRLRRREHGAFRSVEDLESDGIPRLRTGFPQESGLTIDSTQRMRQPRENAWLAFRSPFS